MTEFPSMNKCVIGLIACLVLDHSNTPSKDRNHLRSDNSILRFYHSPIMADRVKEVAVGEADRIKSLTIQAARSAAYLYPIKASSWNLPAFHTNILRSVANEFEYSGYLLLPLASLSMVWSRSRPQCKHSRC